MARSLTTLLDKRTHAERHRPLSVREAAALIGISPQRMAYFIRRGDVLADTLNGQDYVLRREDVIDFDRRRRHSPGHPSFAEQAMRAERLATNESRIRRLRERMQQKAAEAAEARLA